MCNMSSLPNPNTLTWRTNDSREYSCIRVYLLIDFDLNNNKYANRRKDKRQKHCDVDGYEKVEISLKMSPYPIFLCLFEHLNENGPFTILKK